MRCTVRGLLRGRLAVAMVLLVETSCSRQVNDDLLIQHRNLGKAFYENPATQQEAVQEFQQALKLAPNSARDKLNYSLALLRASGSSAPASSSVGTRTAGRGD